MSPCFETDAVHHCDIHSVGDGVRALDGSPGIVLGYAEFCLFSRMPADRRGIEKQLCALQGGEPRAFGIPLVPADQRADPAEWCRRPKPRSPGVK